METRTFLVTMPTNESIWADEWTAHLGFSDQTIKQNMQDFQQRVVEEKLALDDKLKKLEALPSVIFSALPEAEQSRLERQRVCMQNYSNVLGERIANFQKDTREVEILAGKLYGVYCVAVGGKAFNGDALPDWQTFRADQSKLKQSTAWIAVAEKAIIETFE